jgi:hypothetical protein
MLMLITSTEAYKGFDLDTTLANYGRLNGNVFDWALITR